MFHLVDLDLVSFLFFLSSHVKGDSYPGTCVQRTAEGDEFPVYLLLELSGQAAASSFPCVVYISSRDEGPYQKRDLINK